MKWDEKGMAYLWKKKAPMAHFLQLFSLNVHLLYGVFLEAHKMKKEKEMYFGHCCW
jgi:hypothetical protein